METMKEYARLGWTDWCGVEVENALKADKIVIPVYPARHGTAWIGQQLSHLQDLPNLSTLRSLNAYEISDRLFVESIGVIDQHVKNAMTTVRGGGGGSGGSGGSGSGSGGETKSTTSLGETKSQSQDEVNLSFTASGSETKSQSQDEVNLSFTASGSETKSKSQDEVNPHTTTYVIGDIIVKGELLKDPCCKYSLTNLWPLKLMKSWKHRKFEITKQDKGKCRLSWKDITTGEIKNFVNFSEITDIKLENQFSKSVGSFGCRDIERVLKFCAGGRRFCFRPVYPNDPTILENWERKLKTLKCQLDNLYKAAIIVGIKKETKSARWVFVER